MPILEVELKGKISQLEKELATVRGELKKTGDAADSAADKTAAMGKKTAGGVSEVEKEIKKMSSAIIGPAGAVAGVLLLVEAYEAMNTSGNKISRVVNFLAGDIDSLTEAQNELAEAQRKGVSAAEGEIASLKILIEAAQDEQQSKERRQEAIDRINKSYDKLLPNLTLETVGTKKVKEAVDALSLSLIREAKIRGAQNLIAKETEKILEEQSKSAFDAATGWDVLFSVLANGTGPTGGVNSYFSASDKGFKRQQKNISESENKIKAFTERLKTLLSESLDFDIIPTKTLKAPKIKTGDITPIYSSEDLAAIFGLTDKSRNKISQETKKLAQVVNKELQTAAEPVKAYTSRIEDILSDFSSNADQIIQGALVDAFSSIGQVIGNALINGGNVGEQLAKALLGTMGNMLVQLGELAIAAGVTVLAVQQSLTSLNPYVAIAAGVALVAIGSAFAAGANKIGSSSGASSGSVSGQGGSSTSTFTTGGGSGGFGTGRVEFLIRGTTLVGVIQKTLEGNSRLGGNLSLN